MARCPRRRRPRLRFSFQLAWHLTKVVRPSIPLHSTLRLHGNHQFPDTKNSTPDGEEKRGPRPRLAGGGGSVETLTQWQINMKVA